MQTRDTLLAGVGVGVGLVYFFDPERGGRRRARVRDTMVHAAATTGRAAGATSRDALHRTYGTAASLRGALRRDEPDDRLIVERVRAKLGRLVSHPHAVQVTSEQAVVTLRGPVLRAEARTLFRGVRRVRGVRDVVDALEVHERAGSIPALQGGSRPRGARPDLLQDQWAPATRLLAGLAGLAMAAAGVRRRDMPGALMAAAGTALVTRAATNLELRRLVGAGGRRAVDVQKTITINAPAQDVFAFWTWYDNFPHFMSRVLEVRPAQVEGRSHWKVMGPAGLPVAFDAEVTRVIPNDTLAWRSAPRSLVAHAGIVRFEPTANGRTRVHIRMSYNPPAGWIGHGVAAAFGVDPKSSLDADLARMKTLIETGHAPRDAARPMH